MNRNQKDKEYYQQEAQLRQLQNLASEYNLIVSARYNGNGQLQNLKLYRRITFQRVSYVGSRVKFSDMRKLIEQAGAQK